ncbi:MAG: anthranilate synthase component I family protein [Alphaproteobacteria bacterium]|nr:anthranilate synthase component I family protein [Alphaproteobacteria bacterium]
MTALPLEAASGAAGLGLAWREPVEALAAVRDEPMALLMLGGADGGCGGRSYLCVFPDFTIIEDDPAAGFAKLRAAMPAKAASPSGPGLSGGYAGLFGYDLGQAFERTPKSPEGLAAWPAIAVGWYPAVAVFDHAAQTLTVEGEPAAARRLADAIEAGSTAVEAAAGRFEQVWDDARYLQAARRAIDYVRAGDVFQVNLSHPFRGELPGRDGPFRLIERLAGQSPAAFSAYLRIDDQRAVVTNSPERFVAVDASGRVETRPIKGTRARCADLEEDRRAREALAASDKDRAENLMIVDLMRNDLARVCTPGTVRTPDLFKVESFANVHHLVSTVTGQLAEGRNVFDLISAAFPPGSITGAPKVRAMEIIAELEGESRGPYCGALGWIGADGAADLNVMIRTAACVKQGEDWSAEIRSGGAIVIDSDPAEELAETRAKAGALIKAAGP